MFCGWEKVEEQDVLLLLKQLRDLFSTQSNWIHWPAAISALGFPVSPLSQDAVKWSFMGACDLLSSKTYVKPMSDFVTCATLEYLNQLTDDRFIHGEYSYEDEFTIFNLAIEELEKGTNA